MGEPVSRMAGESVPARVGKSLAEFIDGAVGLLLPALGNYLLAGFVHQAARRTAGRGPGALPLQVFAKREADTGQRGHGR